jgi:2C-methyl-D-erythritol 2,4-cyclodiphosphate synthase
MLHEYNTWLKEGHIKLYVEPNKKPTKQPTKNEILKETLSSIIKSYYPHLTNIEITIKSDIEIKL